MKEELKILELEKVKLLTIYKKDGILGIEFHEDYLNDYELYGFLKVYLKAMEERFMDDFIHDDEE